MTASQNLLKPDFVIIGAMKSATSTLQEQLNALPGIYMTTPKEPNFFSNDEVFSKGVEWYSSLFDQAIQSDLKGEASTHYTKLPKYQNTVSRLKSYCPDAKLIYVMRHPVDRLVSHFVHNWSMGFIPRDASIDESVKDYEPFSAYSLYSMQLDAWFKEFSRNAVLPVFFDRLMKEPQLELERICSFIGYQQPVMWNSELQASNVSSQRLRKLPFHSALVDSPFGSWVRQKFIPAALRDSIKQRMRLKNRPQLSEESICELEIIFDKDLSKLSGLFGVDLCCDNFKEVTAQQSLDWIRR